MNYYRLKYAVLAHEIGSTYPQSQIARQAFRDDDPMYIGKQDFGKQLPKNILIPEPVLHPDARLTDLISATSSSRLIVSDRLKEVLKKNMSNDEGEFFPTTVHYLNTSFVYWVLNPTMFRMDLIDYARSEVWVVGISGIKKRKANVTTYDDYEMLMQTLIVHEWLLIDNIVFLQGILQEFIQLSYVKNGGIGYYFSENLKALIERNGFTGIQFSEINA